MLLKGRGQRDTEHLCWGRGVPPGSFRLADALPRAWTTRAPASFWSHGTPGKAQTLGVRHFLPEGESGAGKALMTNFGMKTAVDIVPAVPVRYKVPCRYSYNVNRLSSVVNSLSRKLRHPVPRRLPSGEA